MLLFSVCVGSNLYLSFFLFFFFNDPAPTEIYTLSLHDALPIYVSLVPYCGQMLRISRRCFLTCLGRQQDRKSTRLNSSHVAISYAVFCLKKKKNKFFHHHLTIKYSQSHLFDCLIPNQHLPSRLP